MSVIPGVVSLVGMWWPAADPDDLKVGATSWDAFGARIAQVRVAANKGAAAVLDGSQGSAINAYHLAWTTFDGQLADTTADAHHQAALLRSYCSEVESARSRVLELAVTAAASVAAGFALSFVGGEALAAAAVVALVDAAAAVGITLGTTAAGIIASAAACALIDVFVAQPIRVFAFHDGGFSLTEAGISLGFGAAGAAAGARWQAWRAGGSTTEPIAAGEVAGALSKRLVGVPREPLDRAVQALRGLTVDGKPVVTDVQAFGSRVPGSPPSRVSKDPIFDGLKTPPPTRIGPDPGSDLDVLVKVDPAVSPGGRLDPAVAGHYRQIAADFEAETGYPLHLVIRGSTLKEFLDSVEGAKFVHLP